ncbi:hypothetical protein B0H10DRAFT_2041086, partial [Mycena sp. CBHHK59/15]
MMVKRVSKAGKQEILTLNLTHLTEDNLLLLQKYVDHGQGLPTVSSKTSYKDIWKHTKKFHTTRRAMAALASKISSSSRQAVVSSCFFSHSEELSSISYTKESYSRENVDLPEVELDQIIESQCHLIDDLLDHCDKIVLLLQEFERDSESDLVRLQAEVARLKVATNSKERQVLWNASCCVISFTNLSQELLLELTRAMPIVSLIEGVFNRLTDDLKGLQHILNNLGENRTADFHRITMAWDILLSSRVQLL